MRRSNDREEAPRGAALIGNLFVGWELQPWPLASAATRAALGRVTLARPVATWVVHDLGHTGPIARPMSASCEVERWKANLAVFRPRNSGLRAASAR